MINNFCLNSKCSLYNIVPPFPIYVPCGECIRKLPASWVFLYPIKENDFIWFFNIYNNKNEINNIILREIFDGDKNINWIINNQRDIILRKSLVIQAHSELVDYCKKYKNQLEIEWQGEILEEIRKELIDGMF